MKSLSSLEQLSEALRRLPGVGPKSALRMTYHLLQHDREGAEQIGKAMLNALNMVHNCRSCNTFTENDICAECLEHGAQLPIL